MAEEYPKETTEISLHSERVTVWCEIHEHRIIGPCFFEDGNGQTVTVNGQRYNDMINDFLIHGNLASNVPGKIDLKIWRR